jgi:hypothetical protein
MVTMSQKSSFLQPANSVSQVLIPDKLFQRVARDAKIAGQRSQIRFSIAGAQRRPDHIGPGLDRLGHGFLSG